MVSESFRRVEGGDEMVLLWGDVSATSEPKIDEGTDRFLQKWVSEVDIVDHKPGQVDCVCSSDFS